MTPVLTDRLANRLLFVVGKGGVGKTTTAAATALHWADLGQSTCLISTDPAHSLADVLEIPGPGAVSLVSACSPNLEVEEFDAAAFAERWLAQRRPDLIDLLARGTYLDASDAERFLGLSLPGVDEVMAALRLIQLSKAAYERIVVDCAPTGHFLRLTEAGDLLASWAEALDAMHRKGSAVAVALVGSAPQSGRVVAELGEQIQAFKALLRAADFLAVTRGEDVVEAETKRLLETLRSRDLQVRAVLANGAESRLADWRAPAQAAPPVGCPALRDWLDSVVPDSSQETPERPELVHPISVKQLPDLKFQKSILLVAGKGGVGKSTIASALALAGAGPGCLVSTDPAGSLQEVWQVPIGSAPVEVSAGLRAWQLDADRELRALRERYAEQVQSVFQRLGLDQAVELDRAVIDRLWSLAPPGLDEIMALAALLDVSDQCPRTVLDSAPTGHFLKLIELPNLALQWTHSLLRVLLRYRLAAPLEDFTTGALTFARRTRALTERLQAPNQTGAVLVTLDESVVWSETERLHQSLTRARIPVAALIVNRTDAGLSRSVPEWAQSTRVIRVPQAETPPRGAAALRAFLADWEVLR